MPVASRSAERLGRSMSYVSQNVMCDARNKNHSLCGVALRLACDNPRMAKADKGKPKGDKNGGPSHLKAWRDFREMTQEELAEAVGTNQNMIGYLETGERGLSGKWLRKLAGPLRTTPGLLLDYDPRHINADLIEIWVKASDLERQQIVGSALAIVRRRAVGE